MKARREGMTPREIATDRMSRAFNEWMRRYTDTPETFEREWQTVTRFLTEKAEGKEPSYGESVAAYFMQLLDEIPAA
jgi:hypothetical protein